MLFGVVMTYFVNVKLIILLQGYGALWKGCGSTYVVCAVNFFSEAAISSLTHLPQ